ncbi:MAG: ribonuclease P protein component [Parcubacteria group bacterium]|nr:ribonuclease P protein component [Parcubacteria group bacterium]
MLAKKQKISRMLFKNILSRKKSVSSPLLSVLFSKKDEMFPSRFAFVVSKKVAAKATERNKLKRRGYAFLQRNKKTIKPSFVAAFLLKKGAEKLSPAGFHAEIETLLKKIGAWS